LGENAAVEPIEAQPRSRGNGLCECLLVALTLYCLVPDDASAGDRPQNPDARRDADTQKAARAQIGAPLFPAQSFPAQSFPAPFAFSAPRAEMPVFSPTEFRPRKPGLLEAAAVRSEASVIDAPMLRDTSFAHELLQAKSQDRVRLLTLWKSQASSVSLQAGKHGSPSLQWSTPLMKRGSSSRGLFDRLLPASPRSFVNTVRGGVTRQAGANAPAKSSDLGTTVNIK
jgi:hypothetical protein